MNRDGMLLQSGVARSFEPGGTFRLSFRRACDHLPERDIAGLHQRCVGDGGVELNVITAAPGYMSVLSAAQIAPVIATVPSRIADRYAALLGLDVSPLPVR